LAEFTPTKLRGSIYPRVSVHTLLETKIQILLFFILEMSLNSAKTGTMSLTCKTLQ